MKKKRLNYIDIARGTALFFVILGHLVKFESREFNWIFSFHMPAFFILSGMCFDINKYKSFKEFIIKKFKTIIIPYLGFLLFGILVTTFIWKTNIFNTELLKQLFYFTQPEIIHVGQVWFLVTLCVSNILLYGIYKLFINNFKEKEDICTFIILIVLIYIGYSIRRVVDVPYFHRLPFKLDTAFMSTSFMLVGSIINKKKILEKICNKKTIAIILFIVFGILNYIFGPHLNGYVNICTCNYQNVWYYYISAISGTMCLLIFAYLLSKNKILEYYGRNSLFMFSIHSMFLYMSQNILQEIYNRPFLYMNTIPLKLCIISAFVIYILLVPVTMMYNLIENKIRRS